MAARSSENTYHKMEGFRFIVDWHHRIADAVMAKHDWCKRSYLYIDLYAGPGVYVDDSNYRGDGSPLIALKILHASRKRYEALLFNNDQSEFETLRESVGVGYNADLICDDNRNVLDYLTCAQDQLGLAYFDPNTVRFDVDLGMALSQCLPRLDLLFYFSASAEKRVRLSRGVPVGEGESLSELMTRVQKDKWFVRAPFGGKFQYSFLLGTNARSIGDWKAMGWYDVDSPEGITILTKMNYTREELAGKQAPQLAFPFLFS